MRIGEVLVEQLRALMRMTGVARVTTAVDVVSRRPVKNLLAMRITFWDLFEAKKDRK